MKIVNYEKIFQNLKRANLQSSLGNKPIEKKTIFISLVSAEA